MVKFFKPGKVVVILNGRYAGRKGIIVKSNYENSKERKYPHCVVVGLSKGPRKATKRSLKKMEDIAQKLQKSKAENVTERLNKLKSFGIFIKAYNMSHLLVTRYTVKEELSLAQGIEKLDAAELNYKETKALVNKKEKDKKERKDDDQEEGKSKTTKEIDELKVKLGEEKDKYKSTLRDIKFQIGSEMYNRFMQGFVSGTTPEEKEKEAQTQFLFKKLNF